MTAKDLKKGMRFSFHEAHLKPIDIHQISSTNNQITITEPSGNTRHLLPTTPVFRMLTFREVFKHYKENNP